MSEKFYIVNFNFDIRHKTKDSAIEAARRQAKMWLVPNMQLHVIECSVLGGF